MIKTIQQTLVIALCALLPSLAKAAVRSADEAKEVAAEFFQSGDDLRLGDKDALILAHTVSDAKSNPICYVFNAKDGKGFAIISADEAAMPVLGYSDSSVWNAAMIPGAAVQMLEAPVVMSQASARRNVIARAAQTRKVLATPEWSQEAPFNNMIPNRRLTGCVGVALAEILKYHSYPAARPASLVKDGEPTEYAWSVMKNDNHRSGYTAEQAQAVAAIVADAAIGIGTDFGMSSSSAYEVKVPYALVSLFGYDAGVSYKKRSEMTKAAWDDVIVNEIDADRPVLYSGQDVSAGHAFVCDGYEMRGSTPYFHINWGWGGSANGYYASDALNPVVSKAHSYNDLMTIIYNIKPAANSMAWSDIHVTSDERQAGLNIDVEDISAVASFALRAGALKNISNTNFSGKLAVALFDATGNRKCLLNDGRNFSLVALQISKYVDFSCELPAGVSVEDGDKIRLVTMANGSSEWLPVAGDLLATGEADAKNYAIPYFQVSLPALTGDYAVTADATQVIKGRDYTFTLTPMAADKVITVRANGAILTPGANNVYKLTNVLEDQKVDVIVQNAADVLSKATLWVTAGGLSGLLTDEQCASVKDLTLFGSINATDFSFIRDRMKVTTLDISQCYIAAQGSNPANAIPTKAFQGYRSLKQIKLPKNVTTFKNGCFSQTGLTSIEIPASVGTWEYNVFVSCNGLKEIIARRKDPAWVNWCVFSGVPKSAKLVVPVGSAAKYAAKDYWKDFTNVVEENEVAATSFSVAVSESRNIKFVAQTEGTEFASGASYVFSAEPDDSFGDTTVEVYANTTRLSPDASGNYTAKITANTLIHFEFKQPEPTTPDTTWKLTSDAGGAGLATEVVNVMPGKSFTVRANAIKVPAGADANKFYCMVLTDKNGAVKEFISPVVTNSTAGNLTYNFGCQVVNSTVKEGNLIRLATSYNKKTWSLVGADAEGVCDRIAARGNQVVYHNISMPETMNGARIEGFASQVVHGMPFTVKVTPNSPSDRVTLAVNGVNKAVSQNVANVTIPAVTEDLDITIQIKPAGASDFVVVNVNEGELASKLSADCPARLKLVGTIHVNDFAALRAKAAAIIDLDLADVTIKGAAMTANSIPENAFAPTAAGGSSALKSVVLPSNLERIDQNAFARCLSVTQISIPASVTFVGNGAFAQCNALKKIIMEGFTPPATGTLSPLPSNTSGISLEVPRGAESAYSSATFWSVISPQPAKILYWIKYDNTRAFVYTSYYGDGSKIEFDPNSSTMVQVSMGLPNCPTKSKSDGVYRPGDVFKVYDNGQEVTDYTSPDSYGYGGQYSVKFNPTLLKYGDQYVTHRYYPQNHVIDVVFFYPISFEFGEGADGVKAEVSNTEGGEIYNAPLNKYIYGASGSRTTYREDRDYKFSLDAPAGIELAVEVEQNVMLKPAKGNAAAVYETRRVKVFPDDQGLYTIQSLQGDAKVIVTGHIVVEEGEPLSADVLAAVSKDNVEEFTELTVTGEMAEEQFTAIREKFEAVETLDLSQIENEVIPANAFAGMESLSTVIIPETVTEIGAGAFADCANIETITLPGVSSIGEGAFEGCSSLTSILIPSSDGNNAPAPAWAPRKIARSGSGITAESFRGLNPNCLIYIGSNEIPDSDDLNIILNKDGNRVAASDIHLDANHSFNAPASFLLGEYRISFTEEIAASGSCDVNDGWETIMLPFQPTEMTYSEEMPVREGSGLHLLSFDGEGAETLTSQTAIMANRPYLANISAPFEKVTVTFSAKARVQDGEEIVYDVPFTPVPEETVAVGKDFSLYGSYDGQTRPVDILLLNEAGSAFVRSSVSDGVSIRPFTAYVVPNEGVSASEMAVGEHPIWIFDPASTGVAGTKLYRSGKIELASASKNASIYYTVDGTDPKDPEGSRSLYTGPFVMDGDGMTLNAVAEYKGSFSDVVVLDFQLKKADVAYQLEKNWNWISHFAETPVEVSEFATEGIDGILSMTEEVIRDPKHGLVGSLKALAPVNGYKVSVVGDSWTGSVSGVAFDPAASVKLAQGWNWIGTPVDEGSLLIEDLFAGVQAEEGDMLVGLDGFVQVDADGLWKGTLSKMVPGEGYMFFSNSDKEFVYNIVAAHDSEAPAKAPVVAGEGRWSVDNHRYPSAMPVIASLQAADGAYIDAEDYLVAAFCGDECRGIGAVVDGLVMINVHGVEGDLIRFHFIGADDAEMISSTSILFEEKPEGTFASPVAISLGSASGVDAVTVGSLGIVYENGAFILGADLSDVKSVEIFDLAGKLVAKSNGSRTLNVGDIDGSVVTVVIRKADSVSSAKVLVK